MIACFRMTAAAVTLFLAFSTVVSVHPAAAQNWPMVNGAKERTSYVDDRQFQPPLQVSGAAAMLSANINPFSYYDGVLYGARQGDPNHAVAVDAATGNVLWTFAIPGTNASMNHVPAVTEELVLCGGQHGTALYALDRQSGTELWSTPIGALYTRNVLIDGGRAYVMTDTVFCIDLADGTILWSYDIGTNGNSTPTMDENAVYANIGRRLFALDKTDGTELWSIESYERSYAQVIAGDDTLYASNAGAVRAVDPADGSIFWETEFPEIKVPAGLATGCMALAPDIVCYTAWRDTAGVAVLYALDRHTGVLSWKHVFAGEGLYTPLIVGEYVYVGDYEHDVFYALHRSDGTTAWQMQLEQTTPQAIFADGTLFVADGTSVLALKNTASSVDQVVPRRPLLTMSVAPNPASDQLHIRLSLQRRAHVRISLYNLLGREVALFSESVLDPVSRSFRWSLAATGVPELSPGMYLLTARTAEYAVTNRVMMLGR